VQINSIIAAATALNEAGLTVGASPAAPSPAPGSAPPPQAPRALKKSGGWFGWLFGRPKVKSKHAAAPSPAAPVDSGFGPGANDIFISYARADGDEVYPLVQSLEATGHSVWIDRQGLEAGVQWAAEIVRAIKASETFCLMCSADAFQSDNVRREIYLATKYKRYLVPVLLDQTEMPEDFEYFLVDRNWLDLSRVAESERPQRLIAALTR
jgi:hypothetical protein